MNTQKTTVFKTSANYNILDAGSVITFNNSADLSFSITMENGFRFNLVLKFESTSGEKHELKNNVTGDTITLTCVNFDNPLGTGTTEAIELATVQQKKVYLHFLVNTLGNGTEKSVTYTLYQEK